MQFYTNDDEIVEAQKLNNLEDALKIHEWVTGRPNLPIDRSLIGIKFLDYGYISIYLGDNNYLKVNKSNNLIKDNKENFKTYTCDEFKKEFRRVQ